MPLRCAKAGGRRQIALTDFAIRSRRYMPFDLFEHDALDAIRQGFDAFSAAFLDESF
jgi:hypothetical protein